MLRYHSTKQHFIIPCNSFNWWYQKSSSISICIPHLLPSFFPLLCLPSPNFPSLPSPDFAAHLFRSLFSSVTWIQCSLNPNSTKLSIPASIQPLFHLPNAEFCSYRVIPTSRSLSQISNIQFSPYSIIPTMNPVLIPSFQDVTELFVQHFTQLMTLFHHSRNTYSNQHPIKPLIYNSNFLFIPYSITATLVQPQIPSLKQPFAHFLYHCFNLCMDLKFHCFMCC